MKKTCLFIAIFVAVLVMAGSAAAQGKTFQFMFVNHTNMQLTFNVDDVYACTANPGMVCYSTVAVGFHDFKALQGSTLIRETSGTLYENADNPQWVVCYSETGSCE
ncbi:MAG: hypothetical protein PHY31_09000 [Smithellaceae bacterium]|nr:hypothetical protein [Smithellaceae bacterium]